MNIKNRIAKLVEFYNAPIEQPIKLMGLQDKINPLIRQPLYPVLSTGLGVGANTLLGNPIGGAIDAVSGNAWDLKSDLQALQESEFNNEHIAQVQALVQQYEQATGQSPSNEEINRMSSRLYRMKQDAINRAKESEMQSQMQSQMPLY